MHIRAFRLIGSIAKNLHDKRHKLRNGCITYGIRTQNDPCLAQDRFFHGYRVARSISRLVISSNAAVADIITISWHLTSWFSKIEKSCWEDMAGNASFQRCFSVKMWQIYERKPSSYGVEMSDLIIKGAENWRWFSQNSNPANQNSLIRLNTHH